MNRTWTDNQTAAQPAPSILWWFLGAVLLGFLFLVMVQLPGRWLFLLSGTFLVLAGSFIFEDRKKYYLALLVLAVPISMSKTFFFTRSPVFRSTYGCQVTVVLLPLVVLYVIWFLRRAISKEPAPVSTTGLLPLAGVFLISLISGLRADPLYGAFDMFALSFSVLLFIYAASEIRDLGDLRLVLTCLIITGVMEGVIAIGQAVTGTSLGLGFLGEVQKGFIKGYVGLMALTRVMGTLGHPNQLALFFDFIIALNFSLLFAPFSRRIKYILGAALTLELLGLGTSYSRGGIFWTIMGLGFLTIFHLRQRIGLVRGVVTALTAGILFLVLVFVIPNPIQKGLLRTEYGTAYGRVPLMEVAVNVIRNHPILGIGLNNYVNAARKYDFTPEQITTSWDTTVHNVFLFMAGEIGLVGLAFFLCFLATVMWAVIPAVRSPEPLLYCTAIGLLTGALVYFAHLLTDLTQWSSPRLHWLMLGLMVSLGRMAQVEAGKQR